MSRARLALGVFVFAIGAIVGGLFSTVANPAPPRNPWQALPPVEEPAASAAIAAMLAADNARELARALPAEVLQRLARGVDPIVDIHAVSFTGATERQGDILAAYVVSGRDQSGTDLLTGIVFRVRDGKVVGVN